MVRQNFQRIINGGYFPSFSLGWQVSNEDFFENSGISTKISNLKVRVGWGQTGNQNIVSNAPITLIGTNNEDQYSFGAEKFSQGYIPINTGNAAITWETSEQKNVGLDADFFEDQLSLTLDYYEKKTSDMLLRVPLPAISGYPNNPFSNAGNVEN